jgi:hypothetical protein
VAADLGRRGSITDAAVPSAPRWAGFYVSGQIGLGRAFYDGVFDNTEPVNSGSIIFVSLVNLRMCMRMVRFWRSTYDVLMCAPPCCQAECRDQADDRLW